MADASAIGLHEPTRTAGRGLGQKSLFLRNRRRIGLQQRLEIGQRLRHLFAFVVADSQGLPHRPDTAGNLRLGQKLRQIG